MKIQKERRKNTFSSIVSTKQKHKTFNDHVRRDVDKKKIREKNAQITHWVGEMVDEI